MSPEMKRIDLGQYRKSGEGATGSSYDSLGDKSIMLKLFNEGYPKEQIVSEVELARKVYELGIPSPRPGELVTDGERMGILFQRIIGKRSYARMFADEPERIEEYSREFARYCLKLHSVECPDGLFPSQKDEYRRMLALSKTFNEREKQVLQDFIDSVPDSRTALHGDLHYGNAISTLQAGAPLCSPHEVYFIDLGNFCTGNPLFDLGMFCTCCLHCNEDFLFEAFHIHRPAAIRVWEAFVDEYFGGRLTPDQAHELLIPYQALKMLFVEYAQGELPADCEANIRNSFGL